MAEPRRRVRARLAGLLGVLALLVPLAAGCGGSAQGSDQGGDAFAGTVLQNPYRVDPAPLVGTDGEPFSLADDTDARLTLVFFGYTRCPDICLAVMANLASAVNQLDEADREQVEVVFVTTDPARDTPEVLRTYLDRYDPAFVGATGDLDTIVQVGRSVAVGVDKGPRLPGGGYEVTHSTQVLGLDGDDEVAVYWDQQTGSGDLAADVHTLLDGS